MFRFEVIILWIKVMNNKRVLFFKLIKLCLKGYDVVIIDLVEFYDKLVIWSWKIRKIYVGIYFYMEFGCMCCIFICRYVRLRCYRDRVRYLFYVVLCLLKF